MIDINHFYPLQVTRPRSPFVSMAEKVQRFEMKTRECFQNINLSRVSIHTLEYVEVSNILLIVWNFNNCVSIIGRRKLPYTRETKNEAYKAQRT